ncbi:MAG TPA: hypothetical protein VH933_02740 [Aestuariivirgaceae bacterium]|jgi:hypothetical protein
MFKGIVTAAFGFGVIMTVVFMASQPTPMASAIAPNTTVVKKNLVFPLKGEITIEPCALSYCADV